MFVALDKFRGSPEIGVVQTAIMNGELCRDRIVYIGLDADGSSESDGILPFGNHHPNPLSGLVKGRKTASNSCSIPQSDNPVL